MDCGSLLPQSKSTLMTRYLIPIAIGAALGSLMGYFGQCSSGTCPLTSTWWRGAQSTAASWACCSLSARIAKPNSVMNPRCITEEVWRSVNAHIEAVI
jgi:hypothetical protein